MEHFGIILLVLFCVLFVMGPVSGAWSARKKQKAATEHTQREMQQAKRKLSTVTVYSNVFPGKTVTATEIDLEAGPGECPICIGALAPEPITFDDDGVRAALEDLSSRNTRRPSRWIRRPNRIRTDAQPEPEISGEEEQVTAVVTHLPHDDDVVTLVSCGHAFHSGCLSSWFLIERHDCPVCRGEYYKKPSMPDRALLRDHLQTVMHLERHPRPQRTQGTQRLRMG